MAQSYAACEKCNQLNRVELNTNKQPICGHCKAELPIHGSIIEVSDRTLGKLISKSPLPVVIDIWAQWCGPCRNFAPTFKEASEKYAGKIVFAKLDSDSNPQSANQLGIRSIPTILLFTNGKEVIRQSGAMQRADFDNWLASHGSMNS